MKVRPSTMRLTNYPSCIWHKLNPLTRLSTSWSQTDTRLTYNVPVVLGWRPWPMHVGTRTPALKLLCWARGHPGQCHTA